MAPMVRFRGAVLACPAARPGRRHERASRTLVPRPIGRPAMTEVFLSYAHADDQPMAEGTRGWVTSFADRLQTAARMKDGGSHIHVWMDHRLEPQKVVDAALMSRVAASACFIAILSPRYLESDWCRKELEHFVGRLDGTGSGDRIFLAEVLPTERAAWPSSIRSLSAVPLWEQPFDRPDPLTLGWPSPDPAGDRPYWSRLNELAHVLAQQVKTLGEVSNRATPTRRRVWIADPSDHVLDYWSALASALRQEGFEILPAAVGSYPLQIEREYQRALNADLSRAELLVQLFGSHPGRSPCWIPHSYARIQSEAARVYAADHGVSYLSWRPADIDLDSIVDPDYRALLTGAVANGFEEFRQLVLKRMTTAPEPGKTAAAPLQILDPDHSISICVSADKPDRDLGASVRDLLFELGVDVTLTPEPLQGQSPAQWRRDYEAVLAESQGLVILYGQAPPSWVQTQAQAAKKALAQVRSGLWGALLDLPPADKPDHGMRMRNLMLLNCRRGLATEPLLQFVSALRNAPRV